MNWPSRSSLAHPPCHKVAKPLLKLQRSAGEEDQVSAAGIYLVWDPMHQRTYSLVGQVLTGSITRDW